jgi:hypothetical protein
MRMPRNHEPPPHGPGHGTHSGSGYVTRSRVRRSFLDRYQIHRPTGRRSGGQRAPGRRTSAPASSDRGREVGYHAYLVQHGADHDVAVEHLDLPVA